MNMAGRPVPRHHSGAALGNRWRRPRRCQGRGPAGGHRDPERRRLIDNPERAAHPFPGQSSPVPIKAFRSAIRFADGRRHQAGAG